MAHWHAKTDTCMDKECSMHACIALWLTLCVSPINQQCHTCNQKMKIKHEAS